MHITRLLLVSSLAVSIRAADWPQWRGPQRDGVIRDAEPWPEKLSGLKQVWRVELGPSYSGPLVSGGRVFVTETEGQEREIVRALDRSTGRTLWQREWPGAMKVPFFAKTNGSWIRATPACDGDSLYVAGMRDVLVCLDASDGSERWRFDFVKELSAPLPDFGFVSSPIVDGDSVYVQAGAGFCRVDKKSGKIIWRTLQDQGGMWGSAFSSPAMATLHGQRQLVVQTREKLAGVTLKDGSTLWSQPIEAFRGMNIITPVIVGDIALTSAYGGKTIGWRVSRAGEKWSVEKAWEHKSQGYMTTPVVIDGIAYTHLRSQRAMAIGVADGSEKWTSGESFGNYLSLVANGSRILALDQRGKLYLWAAKTGAYTKLDEFKIADAETWAHLAVCDRELFVRELNAMAVWKWE